MGRVEVSMRSAREVYEKWMRKEVVAEEKLKNYKIEKIENPRCGILFHNGDDTLNPFSSFTLYFVIAQPSFRPV
jgi:hypothetical protein